MNLTRSRTRPQYASNGTAFTHPIFGSGYAYTALELPKGSLLWSKAGWTSQTRHDAVYVELPDGAKFVLVTFTLDHANEREIIPSVAKVIVEGIRRK